MKIKSTVFAILSFPAFHYITGWRLINRTYHLLTFVILDEGIGIGEGTPYWNHIVDDYRLAIKLARDIKGLELHGALDYLYSVEERMFNKRKMVNYGTFLALESALLDALGKARGVPLSSLLGDIYRSEIPVVGTVFLDHPRNMAEEVCRWLSKGVLHLKLKIPLNLSELERTLSTIKSKLNECLSRYNNVVLRVDANEGFKTLDKAIRAMKILEKYDITIIEQPLPRDKLQEIKKLRKVFSPTIKIMLDESLRYPDDVERFAQEEICDIVNFHPSKLGSLRITRETILKAQRLGLEAQIGSALMTEVGVYHYINLAASIPKLDYPLEEIGLYNVYGYSITHRPIPIIHGRFFSNFMPGIGITINTLNWSSIRDNYMDRTLFRTLGIRRSLSKILELFKNKLQSKE